MINKISYEDAVTIIDLYNGGSNTIQEIPSYVHSLDRVYVDDNIAVLPQYKPTISVSDNNIVSPDVLAVVSSLTVMKAFGDDKPLIHTPRSVSKWLDRTSNRGIVNVHDILSTKQAGFALWHVHMCSVQEDIVDTKPHPTRSLHIGTADVKYKLDYVVVFDVVNTPNHMFVAFDMTE